MSRPDGAPVRLSSSRRPRTLVCVVVTDTDTLPDLLFEIRSRYPELAVLLIDGCPGDGPDPLLAWFAAQDDLVEVLRSTGRRRDESALSGFAWALSHRFDLILEMDAEGGYRAGDIARLLAAAGSADLVLADRTSGSMRGAGSVAVAVGIARNLFARLVLEVPLHDPGTGLRAYWASTLRLLDLPTVQPDGLSTRVEFTLRAYEDGLTIREVPVGRGPRSDAKLLRIPGPRSRRTVEFTSRDQESDEADRHGASA